MVLTVDIGNTNIKSGIFCHDELTDFFIHSSLNDFFLQLDINPPEKAIICSVNPKLEGQMIDGLNKRKISSYSITYQSSFNLIIDYKTPATLGIDRLCSSEGAFHLFKKSEKYRSYNSKILIITIDFGTATTINVIDYPGRFIGGLIAPGIEMMFNSLKQETAQLPHPDISSFTSTIGVDTDSSIASGVVTSVTGMIEKTISYLKTEKPAEEIILYITGGNAKKIIPYLNYNFEYVEGLVLFGVNAVLKLNDMNL